MDQKIEIKPIPQKTNIYKALFFLLLYLILVSVVAAGAYFLGKEDSARKAKLIPTPTIASLPALDVPSFESIPPTDSINQIIDESIIPLGPNTVSFTRLGNKAYLKYRGKIYDDSDQYEIKETKLQNPDELMWYGLVDAPDRVVPNKFMNDEVFGFKNSLDNKSFIFIMRWAVDEEPYLPEEFYVYYYNPALAGDKLRPVIQLSRADGNPYVPKIDQFDRNGEYLSFKMYSCWNCGASTPEMKLMRVSNFQMKNIGPTSYFKWLENGEYEYKEYLEKECEHADYMGPCSEDPKNLPLKTGQF